MKNKSDLKNNIYKNKKGIEIQSDQVELNNRK